MTPTKTQAPFGTWQSPLSADALAQGTRLSDVQWNTDGKTLVWLEGRSGEGVLVAQTGNDAFTEISDTLNVRGGVGYGGGEFTVHQDVVIFADKSGRLFRRPLGYARPRPITPQYGCFASPKISPNGKWVLCVHSDGHQDALCVVDANGGQWPKKVSTGADFYMQPVWHPQGELVAWVEWDHPCMPWDGARLMLGYWDEAGAEISKKIIFDGNEDCPVFQPEFSPDGRFLTYLRSAGEYDQLVLLDLETHEKHVLVSDVTLILPAWVQGLRVYAWSQDSQMLYYIWKDCCVDKLMKLSLDDRKPQRIHLDDYTSIAQLSISSEGALALLAKSSVCSSRIITVKNGAIQVVRRSSPEALHPDDIAIPQTLEWQSEDGGTAYGIYFPPASQSFTSEGLPPAIIHVHGGPTSQVSIGFNAEVTYFTSRGYGYLDVNYRGSTGYGRTYMKALRENWGYYDVIDTCSGAKALVARGLVDGRKLIIKGGSAGGYTVLNSLIRYPGLFKAALCSYGVSNLFTLAMDTHKFEERYTESLVGALPGASARYHEWSPAFHAEKIKDAIAIYQGDEDRVVPPSQSEEIVAALKASGTPYEYHLYAGEGHGFRKVETLRQHFQDVERFLLKNVIFSV